ncbi:MAG: magnesium/cobalt transporter CorA [Planctomycetota bacterium]
MARIFRRAGKSARLPSETAEGAGSAQRGKVTITVIDYNEKECIEKEVAEVVELLPFKEKPTVTWINVDGHHDGVRMEAIANAFNLHPLVLENILDTSQRPKAEDYGDYVFLVVKMLGLDESTQEILSEQVSLIIGPNFLLSFQEAPGDVFGEIRQRIRTARGRIRRMGPDFLAYALVDAIVDNYFLILERLGDRIELLEERVLLNPRPEVLHEIRSFQKEMLFLRKTVWPLREVISALEKGESSLFKKVTRPYLRDLYDHTIQVMDIVDTARDAIIGMLDVYLGSVSNRMNEIMKVLTVIGTIFLPLTFIAGVYGMNFKHMPELDWHWGYPAVLSLMLAITVFMLLKFRRRKWL